MPLPLVHVGIISYQGGRTALYVLTERSRLVPQRSSIGHLVQACFGDGTGWARWNLGGCGAVPGGVAVKIRQSWCFIEFTTRLSCSSSTPQPPFMRVLLRSSCGQWSYRPMTRSSPGVLVTRHQSPLLPRDAKIPLPCLFPPPPDFGPVCRRATMGASARSRYSRSRSARALSPGPTRASTSSTFPCTTPRRSSRNASGCASASSSRASRSTDGFEHLVAQTWSATGNVLRCATAFVGSCPRSRIAWRTRAVRRGHASGEPWREGAASRAISSPSVGRSPLGSDLLRRQACPSGKHV